MGRLEAMLDLMTTSAGPYQTRVITFGEFERLYTEIFDDVDENRRKSIAAAANPIYRFRPLGRPVFWRILIAQARLYQALLRTRAATFQIPSSASDWTSLLRLDDAPDFRWRSEDHAGAPLEEVLAVTDQYLQQKVIAGWTRQHL